MAIDLQLDETGQPVWKPVHEDPIIAALLASGAPVQGLPQMPMQPPPGMEAPQTEMPAPPGMLSPPGGPVSPNDFAAPVNPYGQAPVPPAGQPVDPYQSPFQQPDRPGPAAFAPSSAPPPTAPQQPRGEPNQLGDVAGATNALNQSVAGVAGAAAARVDAQLEAKQGVLGRKAAVMDQYANDMGVLDQKYQVARTAARRDAEAETAGWLRDLDRKTKEEPTPTRWFESQNAFGKILFTLSLAFGAMAQSKNPHMKNVGLEMITKEIEADVARQKDRLSREVEAVKAKGGAIDKRLQTRLSEAKDDHTALVTRLQSLQQAALTRAEMPGAAEQKAAYADAAVWLGEKTMEVAGKRLERASQERDNRLNRDAENWRARLTDDRTRQIAAAEIQKDYDLAGIRLQADLDKTRGEKFKDLRVLPPDVTGVRVVDKAGAPVKSELSDYGGLGVDKDVYKDVSAASQLAQDRFAILGRVSKALAKDRDWATLLKKDAQLVSDLQKLGYSMAKENDPRGIVTDKDLASGMETALGGDLNSLSGRIASGTFSAGQGDLKAVVDKALNDMPSKVSTQLGHYLDASKGKISGYDQPGVRVDWTPKKVEGDELTKPTTRQVDAKYGITSPVSVPSTVKELESAQALEKRGVEALPPYRQGSQDAVVQALKDFNGALPEKIAQRAEGARNAVAGDRRAELEIEQAKEKEVKRAEKRVEDFSKALKIAYNNKLGYGRNEVTIKGSEMVTTASKLATKYGLTDVTGDELLSIMKRLNVPTVDTTFNPSGNKDKSTKFE